MSRLKIIGGLKFRDIELVMEVARAKSIREAARRLGSTPGHVSRGVRLLENRVGRRLFRRSASGVLLSGFGASFVDAARDLVEGGQRIESLLAGGNAGAERTLGVAGTSFLSLHFTAPIACGIAPQWEGLRFRFLDLAPDQLVAAGLRGAFEIAVHYGKISWPGTWVSERLGRCAWLLCARAGHKLGPRAPLARVLEYPFVVPTYWTHEGLVHGDDQFPLPFSKRRAGFETATADAAVPVILGTDQVAYLPSLLVEPFVKKGEIKVLTPPDLKVVEKEIWLSARADSVPASLYREIAKEMKRKLES